MNFMGKGNCLHTGRIGGLVFMGKKYGEKFFYDAYFIDRISTRDFLFFMGVVFKVKNFGKKICKQLFGPYSKKPPGPGGEGVQGTG